MILQESMRSCSEVSVIPRQMPFGASPSSLLHLVLRIIPGFLKRWILLGEQSRLNFLRSGLAVVEDGPSQVSCLRIYTQSTVLIIGRAIAGKGAAGVMSGVMQIMFHVIPLHRTPIFDGMFGAAGGIA